MAEIGEDARGDADGGRGERTAEEDGHERREVQRRPDRVAAREGESDARDGDDDRGPSAGDEPRQLGLETDEEEQQNDAELREEVDDVRTRIDEAQSRDADEHAAEELSEDGGLADPLRQLAEELRGDE